MSDDHPHYGGKSKALLSKDGSRAIVTIGAEQKQATFSIDADMIAVLMAELRNLSAKAEERRRGIEPFAGRDGDTLLQAALRPTNYGVGKSPDGNTIGVMFHVSGAPETFALTPVEAADIARRLLAEVEGRGIETPKLQ